MTHYNISYQDYSSRHEADLAAVADIHEYLSDQAWLFVLDLARDVVDARYGFGPEGATIPAFRLALNLMGIEGYPVDAFCRVFLLEAYRDWMHDDSKGGPVWTDSDGFQITPDSYIA